MTAGAGVGEPRNSRTGDLARRLVRSEALPLAFAAAWVGAVAVVEPAVLTRRNLENVGLAALPLLLAAVGQLFVLVVGGIDLSTAAVAGAASVAAGLVMREVPNAAVGVGAVLAVGLGVGLFHGLAVAGLRMPAFLVTLATSSAVAGGAVWATRSQKLAGLPEGFLSLGWQGDLFGVRSSVWVAAVVVVVAHLVLARTVFGRQLYAVGLNAATARVSGVPVGRRIAAAFAVSGVCAAVAGLMLAARQKAAAADLWRADVLLDVLGAAVIGGASLRGGRGTVLGVVVGVAVIALIGNTLTLLDLDSWHVTMAKGGLIFLAAGLDILRTRGDRR